MKQYFKELRNIEKRNPELKTKGKTKDELIDFQTGLYKQWKYNGDELARNKLWMSVLKIIYQDVSELKLKHQTNIDIDELVAEANLAVFKSLESFDPNKQMSFTSWCRYRVLQSFLAYIGSHRTVVKTPLKLKQTIENEKLKNVKINDVDDYKEVFTFEENYGDKLRTTSKSTLEMMMDNNIFSQLKSCLPIRDYEVLKGLSYGMSQTDLIEILTPITQKEKTTLKKSSKNTIHIKIVDMNNSIYEEVIKIYAGKRYKIRGKGLLSNKFIKTNFKYQTNYVKNKKDLLLIKFKSKIKSIVVTHNDKEISVSFDGKYAKSHLELNYGYVISKMDLSKLKQKIYKRVRDNENVIFNLKDFL